MRRKIGRPTAQHSTAHKSTAPTAKPEVELVPKQAPNSRFIHIDLKGFAVGYGREDSRFELTPSLLCP